MQNSSVISSHPRTENIYTGPGHLSGPRGCSLSNGQLLISFMSQTRAGSNDFKPLFVRGSANGTTWDPPSAPFSDWTDRYSIFGHVSKGAGSHDLLFFGSRCPRYHGDEDFWDNELSAMLPNELFWAKSSDDGLTWGELLPIRHPVECAAEVTSPIFITKTGRWIACFSPYRTTTLTAPLSVNRTIFLFSDDEGGTWDSGNLFELPEESCAGEAWVVPLSNGRLLATGWHVNLAPGKEPKPNVFSVSSDEGRSWSKTSDTPILGQSTALLPWGEGAMFAYNQRIERPFGIGVAFVRPTAATFGVQSEIAAWQADQHSKANKAGGFDEWTSFSFGEPSFLPIDQKTILLLFWRAVGELGSIDFVRLNVESSFLDSERGVTDTPSTLRAS